MRVAIKGLNQVTKRLADGRRVTYWYAWKGGPRLPPPSDPAFVAAYAEVLKDRRTLHLQNTLAGLIVLYKSSPEYQKLAPSTKAEWGRWLARISEHDIGQFSYSELPTNSARQVLIAWRDTYADRPRTADYGMQVLSRVLQFGFDRRYISANPVAGVGKLYENDRAEKVWEPGEIARFRSAAKSPEVGFIVALACLTGLRREDLTRLAWSHVGDVAIIMPTGKSRGRKTVVIPLLDETRALLEAIKAQQDDRYASLCATAARKGQPEPPRPLTVLSNTRCRPWTPDGLEHQVVDAKGLAKIDKHLHDARGTFGTRLRRAGLTAPEIADVLGWEEERVERLLATYVDRDSIVLALANRIRRNESRDETPNRLPTGLERKC